jgi:predicted nucleotidyltransferase
MEAPGDSGKPVGQPAGPPFRTELAEVCWRLNEAGALYLLVGARALQLWGSARATRDIDILIEPTEANARRVLDALALTGYGFAKEWTVAEVARKFVTIIGDSPRVDILTLAWSVRYRDAVRSAERFEVEGVEIPTVSLDDLIASKRTGRPQDVADVLVLEEIRRSR